MRTQAVGAILFLTASLSFGQMVPDPPVDPATYTSPNGHYKLRINPDDIDASAGAAYRLTHDGALVWEKHFPFALRKAGLTDQGQFGGYAVTHSLREDGWVVVAIVSADGTVTLKESHDRKPAPMSDAPPDPIIPGLIFDPANDRMIVRARTYPRVDSGGENWWTYRLSDSKRQPTLTPERFMGKTGAFIQDAQPLPGSRLTLLSWWDYSSTKLTVALIDREAKPVWRLDVKAAQDLAASRANSGDNSAILAVSDDAFVIREASQKLKVSYRVQPTAKGWAVAETSKEPLKVQTTPEPDFPKLPIAHLPIERTWTVPLQKLPNSPIHDVESFQLIEGNRIACFRADDSPALIVSDRSGAHGEEIPLPMLSRSDYATNLVAWLGGPRFLLIHSQSTYDAYSKIWELNILTKRKRLIVKLGQRSITAVAVQSGGRFVCLSDLYGDNRQSKSLSCYNPSGRQAWEVFSAPTGLGATEDLFLQDLSIDAKNRVVALDNIGRRLQIFSLQGKYLSTVKLPSGNDLMSYTTHVHCVDSGYLIEDFGSFMAKKPSIFILDSHGKTVKSLTPHFANSKPLESQSQPQFDSQGNLWMCDNGAVYRVNRQSVVDQTIGRIGGSAGLSEIANLQITARGDVIATDRTSDQVDLFNPSGNRVASITPPQKSLPAVKDFLDPSASTDDKGDIFISASEGYLRYSASGQPEGLWRENSSNPSKPLRWWRGATLFDGAGTVINRITRLPNENWVERYGAKLALDPNRAVAVLSSRRFELGPSFPFNIGFYDPAGKPESMITLTGDPFKISSFAYDGTAVYLAVDNNVLAFDKTGKGLYKLPLPPQKDHEYSLFSTTQGLAVFDGVKTITWYDTTGDSSRRGLSRQPQSRPNSVGPPDRTSIVIQSPMRRRNRLEPVRISVKQKLPIGFPQQPNLPLFQKNPSPSLIHPLRTIPNRITRRQHRLDLVLPIHSLVNRSDR